VRVHDAVRDCQAMPSPLGAGRKLALAVAAENPPTGTMSVTSGAGGALFAAAGRRLAVQLTSAF
jgi:hypothetical protein